MLRRVSSSITVNQVMVAIVKHSKWFVEVDHYGYDEIIEVEDLRMWRNDKCGWDIEKDIDLEKLWRCRKYCSGESVEDEGLFWLRYFGSDEIIWSGEFTEMTDLLKRRNHGSGIVEDILWMWRNYIGGEIMDVLELWSWWII